MSPLTLTGALMKWSKHRRPVGVLIVAVLLILSSLGYLSHRRQSMYPGDIRGSVTVGGLRRTFIVHLPADYSGNKTLPLIIALHGGGGSGFDMERLTKGGLNRLADEHGFIVVYPDAVGKHWNDGRNLSRYESQRKNVDDVGFIVALIGYLTKNYHADPRNVFVVGMSNGGLMTYRLACEVPERLRAVAVVGVSMSTNLYENCTSNVPLPILIILGTEDSLVPWGGGELHFGPLKLGKAISINETVSYWVKRNGCALNSGKVYLPDKDPKDGTRVWMERHSHCRGGAEVVFYGIDGGGHTWPGGYQYLPERIIGRTSRDINADQVIWNFFAEHMRGK